MYAFKRVIAVSALTLTANSWSYPIYPFSDFFNRSNVHRSLNIKSDMLVSKQASTEQLSAESFGKIPSKNNLTVMSAFDPDSPNNAFSSNSIGFDQRSNVFWESGFSWHLTAQKTWGAVRETHHFALDMHQDEKLKNGLKKEEIEALMSRAENAGRWAGLGLQNILPGEGKNNSTKQGGAGSLDSNVSQISVSEPSSIALMCSGALGLMLARRLSRKSRKGRIA